MDSRTTDLGSRSTETRESHSVSALEGHGAGASVLIVDDDERVAQLMSRALASDGFTVVAVNDAPSALLALTQGSFDAAVVDVVLPGMTGLELCEWIHEAHEIPVILVSGLNTTEDLLAGLDSGAEDYITKPFDLWQLRARVRERVQRAGKAVPGHVVTLGDVSVDTAIAEVRRDGHAIDLTMTEFRLLLELIRHRGEPVSRDELLEVVWASHGETHTRMVDMAVKRLREKLERDPKRPRLIKTARGKGYFVEQDVTRPVQRPAAS